MVEYVAYATQVSKALQALLETTQVKIAPAVEFVSCGAGLHEHFVPKTALEKHLRKCHGERRPRPINNAAFYYGRRNEDKDAISLDSGFLDDRVKTDNRDVHDEDAGLQSLVEPKVEGQEGSGNQEGVIAAIQKAATTVGEFYDQVQAWQRIPRRFATMKDNERALVTPSSLRRWLNAELSRPGVLPSGDLLDEELVEYVAGLLDHPDFCQPDLLVLELHEFLGSCVTKTVLALWKFMVVEIGLHSVFKMEKSKVDNKIQVCFAAGSSESIHPETTSTSSQTQSNDAVSERDYKRRRASYRGKVGTKTGQAAFREMIQKHMIDLSLETDRELVLGGGFRDEEDSDNCSSKAQQIRREPVDWYNFTDALEVRNRSRSRRHNQSSHKKRQSRSRTRSRSRERFSMKDLSGAVDHEHHRHKSGGSKKRSTEHRRGKSRSRSRSPRRRDSDRHHRKRRRRSTSVGRDGYSRDRRRGDYRR